MLGGLKPILVYAMPIHTQVANDEVTIVISGRFDFNAHREFREAVKAVSNGSTCVVDLGETTYLDSSALGMLLLLRDGGREVRIVKCTDEVRKVLEIANFHRLFNVS